MTRHFFVGAFPTYYIALKGEPYTWVGKISFKLSTLEVQASTDDDFEAAMAVARERADFIGVPFPKTVIRKEFESYDYLLPKVLG